MSRRKICAVTGSRADYGHLFWILQALKDDPRCALTVVATGAHLSATHGGTFADVAGGGYAHILPVDIELGDDSGEATAAAMGRATARLAAAFAEIRPDLILILGDRYEILGAAQAALMMRIPVAHVHGGEVTRGAFDDAVRHAVTKMSHLHFAAAAVYADRICQMGEDPAFVFAFGAPGLDHLKRTPDIPTDVLAADIGFDPSRALLLVTYHPVTLEDDAGEDEAGALLRALERFVDGATLLCTGVNADPGHRRLARAFEALQAAHPGKVLLAQSLGQRRYLAAMRRAAAVVGNSSSGMIEAPALGRPTVNIGSRQDGRLRGDSIIDCPAEEGAIADAISRALGSDFQATAAAAEPPLGRGGASARIAATLTEVPLDGILRKKFHDRDVRTCGR